jgi:hypothetical protein
VSGNVGGQGVQWCEGACSVHAVAEYSPEVVWHDADNRGESASCSCGMAGMRLGKLLGTGHAML